jgi:hypothetical protein
MAVKNMGMNLTTAIRDASFKPVSPKTRNLEKVAKQAKRDFARYAMPPQVKSKEKEVRITRTCKTYLCNWQGLTILGSTCPVCGQKLVRL